MNVVELNVDFEPQSLKSNMKNEFFIILRLKNTTNTDNFWCECDINVIHPLSLAQDKELAAGRTRIGIITGNETSEKRVKIYTRPNNYPDKYKIKITAYIYDKEGIIAQRIDREEKIECI